MIKYILLLLILTALNIDSFNQVSLDTLVFQTHTDNNVYYPSRPCHYEISKMKTGEIISNGGIRLDSIMLLQDTIFKSNQTYYLILKNKRGQILMEGNFFDQYANGSIIEYYYNGNKKFEGTNRLVRLEKGKKVCRCRKNKIMIYWESERVGEWKFYDLSGKLEKTINYP